VGIGEGEEDRETFGVAVGTDDIDWVCDDVVGAGVGEGFAVRAGVVADDGVGKARELDLVLELHQQI
jgi:hypothetical protein